MACRTGDTEDPDLCAAVNRWSVASMGLDELEKLERGGGGAGRAATAQRRPGAVGRRAGSRHRVDDAQHLVGAEQHALELALVRRAAAGLPALVRAALATVMALHDGRFADAEVLIEETLLSGGRPTWS